MKYELTKGKRLLSLLLAVSLLLGCVPLGVFAEEMETAVTEETAVPTEEKAAPTEETAVPTEETTEPTEETTEPTEETTEPAEETAAPTEAASLLLVEDSWDHIHTDALYNKISVTPGQLVGETGEVVENEIYGYVANYPLKKGHVLSISDEGYVFSVRKLENGNYSNLLKAADTTAFTAKEDMTVAMLVRKPDKAPVTAEELAGVVIYDSQFGMIGTPGSVHRFTVEAKTIDGGRATTRAAIFLPPSYSETGEPTRLVIMTNGRHAYLTDSVWNGNSTDDVGVMRHYMENNYAVLVVNNTADRVNGTADWGNPQLVSSYWEAYAYAQANFHVEERFSLHSRSMGTFAAVRIMRERPELVKCALMCGAVLSLESRFGDNPAFLAKRYGFEDLSGATYEADKVVGYDPYTDVNGLEYDLPPTFWMMSEADATSAHLATIEKIKAHGNNVETALYTETDHSGVCRLNIEACRTDSLAFLETHQESTPEHRFRAWEVTEEATCQGAGEMRRYCADCSHYESLTIPALPNHVFENSENTCDLCGTVFDLIRTEVPVIPGQLDSNSSGTILDSEIYGSVVNHFLEKGHTLSISDRNYVFSVRILKNGTYSTMLKAATTDSFTATEDMTVGCLIRKPDRSAVTAEELAAVQLVDTGYVRQEVPGEDNPSGTERDPMHFAWEMEGEELRSVGPDENAAYPMPISIPDGWPTEYAFGLEHYISLRHDLPWSVEWKCEGSWQGTLFAEDYTASAENACCLTRTKGGQLCFGSWTGSQYDNYGVDISWLDDGVHTYRLENCIAADGSNMVWLFVDELPLGPMNNYFVGSSDQHTASDWVSGKDFTFFYIGTESNKIRNCALEYLEVREDGHTHSYEETVTAPTCLEKGHTTHTCTVCGDSYTDSYVEALGHRWQDDSAIVKECTVCGHVEGGYRIEAPAQEVWIDGVRYAALQDEKGSYILLEGTDAEIMTVYSCSDPAAEDVHTQYPTAMQVWRLRFENGGYTVEALPELENVLQYAGSSIRVTGVKGIRMITAIPKTLRGTLMAGTLGYTLKEYGTAVTWAAEGVPVLGKGYTMSNFAYRQDVADPIFADTGDAVQYTNVLVGFTDDQLARDLILRPYMILEDSEGQQITIYGGCVQRSIGYIAKQNQETFPTGSKADAYIEDILSKVYG